MWHWNLFKACYVWFVARVKLCSLYLSRVRQINRRRERDRQKAETWPDPARLDSSRQQWLYCFCCDTWRDQNGIFLASYFHIRHLGLHCWPLANKVGSSLDEVVRCLCSFCVCVFGVEITCRQPLTVCFFLIVCLHYSRSLCLDKEGVRGDKKLLNVWCWNSSKNQLHTNHLTWTNFSSD